MKNNDETTLAAGSSEPDCSVSLAPLSWSSGGSWRACRKCGKHVWETNLGECRSCRGDKWLATDGGELIRQECVYVTPEIIELIEDEVGIGYGAWDCVDPVKIISAAWKFKPNAPMSLLKGAE